MINLCYCLDAVESLSDRLIYAEERQSNFALPTPLDERINALIELLELETGDRISRKELVGALVLAAPTSVGALQQLLTHYRLALAEAALIPGFPPVDGKRRPGPRPRRKHGGIS
jgi:hypothetical protein